MSLLPKNCADGLTPQIPKKLRSKIFILSLAMFDYCLLKNVHFNHECATSFYRVHV